ncbi:MAG: hypothetical protein LBS59_01790 [Puniceicoccales bacterium]|nr:hypothetical protein [Puniceicoccales bacterium]
MSTVAVVDVGSNTLKILVAQGKPFRVVAEHIEETRISPMAEEAAGKLSPRAFREGVGAIKRLLGFARRHGAAHVRMVATSAVRSAANGREFAEAVSRATGFALEIIDGNEEARGIAAGVAGDPRLAGLEALHILDLGGGSMEYIFRVKEELREMASFPLGGVLLTRRFVDRPEEVIPVEAITAIGAHVRESLGGRLSRGERKTFSTGAEAFVGCGGVFSVSRLIFAAERGSDSAEFSVADLRHLRDRLAGLPKMARAKTPGLPRAQAEIFPVALSAVLAVADWFGVEQVIHSRRNLRYGIAEAELEKLATAEANTACAGDVPG